MDLYKHDSVSLFFQEDIQFRLIFFVKKKKKVSSPCNRLWRPIRLCDVKGPTFSRKLAHRWQLGFQPSTPCVPYPRNVFWYSFLLED
jgi:hypothetical protein